MTDTLAAVPPKARGAIETHPWKDGRTITYQLRVRAYGRRHRVDLGTNHEGWNPDRAQVELDKVMAQIERGTWQSPDARKPTHDLGTRPVLGAVIDRWWKAKRRTIKPNTIVQYRWAIKRLGKDLGDTPVTDIDGSAVRRLRDDLVAEGLAPRSVNVTLRILAAILDDAIEDKLIDSQPVTKRHRVAGERKQRSFLEPDMVRDILDAASALEREARRDYKVGRRAMVATLCLAGIRRQELCDAKIGHLDLAHHRLKVPDAKTEAGVREVELTLWLAGELRAHLADLRRRGMKTGPGAWLFPTAKGGQRDPDRLNDRIVQKAAVRATETRAETDGPPLPHATPHTLRRTYASLALAAGREPRWVMAQMGHTDPELTLRVYAQVMKRQRQDDTLIWELMRFADEPEDRPNGRSVGSNGSVVRPKDWPNEAPGPSEESAAAGS